MDRHPPRGPGLHLPRQARGHRLARRAAGLVLLCATPAWAETPAELALQSGHGLTGAVVTALEQDHGVLWIGTQRGGVCAFDGEALRCRATPAVHALLPEPDGAWLGTPDGLLRLQDDVLTAVLPHGVLGLVRHDEQLWVATANGLFRQDADTFTEVRPGVCTHLVVLDDKLLSRCSRRWTVDGEPTDVWGPDEVIHAVADADDPGGHWLAAGMDGLVAQRGEQHVSRWLPTDGPVWDVARVRGKLALATAQGLTWWDPESVEVWSVEQGIPGEIRQLEPGPGDGLWVGTTEGVFLVDADGPVTPLPRAPVPADAPVWGVWPSKSGVGVFHDLGSAWVGKRAPRGFSALLAAVGPYARHAAEGWVLTDRAALHLDKRGTLHRFELTAPGHLLARVGEAVVFATDAGLQWWLPGATGLGSPWATEPVVALSGAGGVGVWVATEDTITLWTPAGPDRSWSVATPALVAHRGGVVFALQDAGLAWLDRAGDEPDPIVGTEAWGPIVAVTVAQGELIAANDAGELFRLASPAAPFAVTEPGVLELTWEDGTLFVSSLGGLHQLELAPQ